MCLYIAELTAKVIVSVPYIHTQNSMLFKYVFATILLFHQNLSPSQPTKIYWLSRYTKNGGNVTLFEEGLGPGSHS